MPHNILAPVTLGLRPAYLRMCSAGGSEATNLRFAAGASHHPLPRFALPRRFFLFIA